MFLVIFVVFVGVFVLTVLIFAATGANASQREKRTMAMFDAVLAPTGHGELDEVVDIRKQDLLSSIPMLNQWLVRMDVAPRLRLMLYQANLKWTVGGLLLACLASGAFGGWLIYLRTHSLAFAAGMGAVLATIPYGYVAFKRSQQFARFEQKLPEALDMMVSALRAGHSLISSISIVAREAPDPIGREFRKAFDEQNFGLELRTAMNNLTTRFPLQDLRILVTAVLIQQESGGNLAEVLDKVATVIRDRFRLKRQIAVHTAQGRMTGWVLSLLPVILGFLLYLVNPEHMSILWKRSLGIKLLCAAGVMMVLGAATIRKICRVRI